MDLIINGQTYRHEGTGALIELMREYKAEPGRTAVMINGIIVRKNQLDSATLAEGDQVELITIAAGG
jgi:thiamine biosynthesis protein ThiS